MNNKWSTCGMENFKTYKRASLNLTNDTVFSRKLDEFVRNLKFSYTGFVSGNVSEIANVSNFILGLE